LLFHLGFSKSVIKNLKLRSDGTTLSPKAIERAMEKTAYPLAYREKKWLTTPRCKMPSRTIVSQKLLVDYSLFCVCLTFICQSHDIKDVSLTKLLHTYDLYTNTKKDAGEIPRLSPDSAYWLTQEYIQGSVRLVFCKNCTLYFIKSAEQKVKLGCPFC
jgi:hypothetical protein